MYKKISEIMRPTAETMRPTAQVSGISSMRLLSCTTLLHKKQENNLHAKSYGLHSLNMSFVNLTICYWCLNFCNFKAS